MSFVRSSQALLESLCNVRVAYCVRMCCLLTPLALPQSFDGVRRRCLPVLYESLEPGTEDDRMKGALWTLNLSVFGEHFV